MKVKNYHGIILGSILLCSKSFYAAQVKTERQTEKQVFPVKTQKVEMQNYIEYGEYIGNIAGILESQLVAYQGGRVNSIKVKNGDTVKKGQPLCDIDADVADTGYEAAYLSERVAYDNWKRNEKHQKTGTTSKLQVRKSKLAWLNAKDTLLKAKKIKEGAHCISPIAGTVLHVDIEEFQDVHSGQATIHVAQLDKIKLKVGIPESEIHLFEDGKLARVELTSRPGPTFEGNIENISQVVDSKDKTFQAEVYVGNQDHLLKPGLTARVKLLKYDLKNQIILPSNSILLRRGKNYVMTLNNDNTVTEKEVVIFSQNNDESVISQGINKGDQVIVKGQHLLTNGAQVEVVND